MKTFREFILEAEGSDWWTRGRKEASQKLALLRRQRGGTVEQQISTSKKIEKLEQEISNKDTEHSDTRPKETKRQKRQQNAVRNTGRAQKHRDVISSSGTLPGIRKTTVPEPSDTIRRNKDGTSGRYGTTFGGGGTGKSRSGGNIG